MVHAGRLTLLLVLAVMLAAGCQPPVSRLTTAVKSAAEVKITAGKGTMAEPPAEAPAAAPASAPATAAAPAASSAATAPPATSPASAAAPVATAPAAATQPTDGPAKIVGKVTLKGAAPGLAVKLAKGAATKDAICAENEIPDPRLVASVDGGLANVVIYMAKPPAGAVPAPAGDAPVIDQKGCVFVPHVVVCRVGQAVKLLNSDPVAHNVNFTGLADQFNQILGQNQSAEYNFRKASRLPIPIKCDIHGWMSAHVIPLDHPWAAVTDANGNFEISNLPDGEFEFVVWHEAAGYIERSLKVKTQAGQAVQLPVTVDVGKLKL